MKNKKTLIVPCAGRSRRYPGVRPKWLLTHPDGQLMIEKALTGFDMDVFDRVIITIVREHAETFEAETILREIFTDKRFEIFVLDDFTQSASETVYKTLKENQVQGSFVIKDSDNHVSFSLPDSVDSYVVGLNLNTYGEVSNITGKSFLIVNEQQILLDIVEKDVRSNVICLGVYAFADAKIFMSAYEELMQKRTLSGEMYVSHVLSYMIAKHSTVVRYLEARNFEDWGTLRDWQTMQSKHQTYFVDLDGVLLKNTGRYGQVNWSNNREVLPDNIELIQNLQKRGGQIVLVTSRPEKYREATERILRDNGLSWHSLIMGCHHSRRVMINDFAPSNPYPSCVAVNLPRNGKIKDYLPE